MPFVNITALNNITQTIGNVTTDLVKYVLMNWWLPYDPLFLPTCKLLPVYSSSTISNIASSALTKARNNGTKSMALSLQGLVKLPYFSDGYYIVGSTTGGAVNSAADGQLPPAVSMAVRPCNSSVTGIQALFGFNGRVHAKGLVVYPSVL
jgi:hypothetical protein